MVPTGASPGGIIINSWTQGPIASNMGGEPGMSIVPNSFFFSVLSLGFAIIIGRAYDLQKGGQRVAA